MQTGVPTAIPHDLEGKDNCLMCHKTGVMEAPVTAQSELCGQTVKSSGLRDRDVIVLTIQRESVTIPNPRTDREFLAGDTLLCFGKMLTLRSLAPPKIRKKKKKKLSAPTEVASE